MVYLMCVMFALIAAGSNVLAEGVGEAAAKSCQPLFLLENIERGCCSTVKKVLDNEKDCKQNGQEKWTCDLSRCMLGSKGVLDGDEINAEKMAALLDKLAKETSDIQELAGSIKEACLTNDTYKQFPPESDCMPMRFQFCAYVVAMVECRSWKDSDECKQLAKQAETCRKDLEEVEKNMKN